MLHSREDDVTVDLVRGAVLPRLTYDAPCDRLCKVACAAFLFVQLAVMGASTVASSMAGLQRLPSSPSPPLAPLTQVTADGSNDVVLSPFPPPAPLAPTEAIVSGDEFWLQFGTSPKLAAHNLVRNMTWEEKVSLLRGYGWTGYRTTPGHYVGNVPGIPRLGIPSQRMQDAAQGFRTTDPRQCLSRGVEAAHPAWQRPAPHGTTVQSHHRRRPLVSLAALGR